MAAKC